MSIEAKKVMEQMGFSKVSYSGKKAHFSKITLCFWWTPRRHHLDDGMVHFPDSSQKRILGPRDASSFDKLGEPAYESFVDGPIDIPRPIFCD